MINEFSHNLLKLQIIYKNVTFPDIMLHLLWDSGGVHSQGVGLKSPSQGVRTNKKISL